jgi:dipeptidyl aminopeptidase/acylaminoacyl peptidase
MLLFVAAPSGVAQADTGDEPPLIPRTALFGNPDRASVQISADGTKLAWLAPVDGVMNVWVAPRDDLGSAKAVTKDTGRGIRAYFWAYTNEHILYLQDTDGDENWRVYSVDLGNDKIVNLTDLEKVQARIQGVSRYFPDEILIALNDRNPTVHDVHRVNIRTGERELVQQNDAGYVGFVTDDQYQVRLASKITPDGGNQIFLRTEEDWDLFMDISAEDTLTTGPAGFDKTGESIYAMDSRDRNTGALVSIDLKTREKTLIAEDRRSDIAGVMRHPIEKNVEAVAFNYTRREWKILDKSVAKDFAYLNTVADGEFNVTDRTLDDRRWVVAFVKADGPVRYYLYNRDEGKAHFLFTNRTALEGSKLADMYPVVIPSRDGRKLVSYLTLPVGTDKDRNARPDKPLPMVLFVHGGPWYRDSWGYNPYHQWLANRGYAVLSVNFRGSTGFGKDFVNAGDREWGAKMHDDLIDAVNWTVKNRIADAKRVAVMGGSYGGYATLIGMTFTPEVFACGVDIVGPSSLVTLLESFPPYWKPMIDLFAKRVGDHRTEEGREFLLERSPLTRVDHICRPLLIGQGANDPRVKQAEADRIVQAMQSKSIPVTYVLYPDEGHGFARPENSLSFNAITEAFLAEHLGGRMEPIGDDFKGSSVEVPTGAEQVPGLKAALLSVQ